jgi:hypothetical protein
MKILFATVCLLVGMAWGQDYLSTVTLLKPTPISDGWHACLIQSQLITCVQPLPDFLSAPLPDRITQDSGQVYRLDGADSDHAFTVNDLSLASRQPRFTPCELPSGEVIQSSANQAFTVIPACVYDSEPMDVPAIQEPRRECIKYGIFCATGATSACPICEEYGDVPESTCQDKSRVLETAEDGKHWCRAVKK